jgi:hypothetical protein
VRGWERRRHRSLPVEAGVEGEAVDEDEPVSYLDHVVLGSLGGTDLDEDGWLTRERVLRALIGVGAG